MAFFESHPDRTTLQQEFIFASWNAIIPEAAGRGEKFLEGVAEAISAMGIPDMKTARIELETVAAGERVKGLYLRPALEAYCITPPLKGYIFYFSAKDFGKHLILSRFMKKNSAEKLSPFSLEEVGAYFKLVNSHVLAVVKKITEEAKQDFSKLNIESTGVIDIA